MALGARQEDGSTLRELLMSLAARGTIDRRLTRRPPPETAMLWRVYVEVPARPLTPSELLAWQQLTGIRLTPWEVDTLLYMDRVVADAARKQGG